jgi:hypothetical protein
MQHRTSHFSLRADSRVMALLAGIGAALVVLLYGVDDVDAAEGDVVCGYR